MRRDATRPELTQAERILLGYLHRHCRGAERARTYARLREALRGCGLEVDEREMYDLVKNLVLKGRPVGTTSARGLSGAFVLASAEDVEVACRNLRGRIYRQLRRFAALQRTAREMRTGQTFLGLQEAERAYEAAARGRRVETAVEDRVRKRQTAADQGLLFGPLAPGSRT